MGLLKMDFLGLRNLTVIQKTIDIIKDRHNKTIDIAKSNIDIAKNMVMKIQGLKIMNFFIKNKKNLSAIMNKMINGAKKIDDSNGFFIKIY